MKLPYLTEGLPGVGGRIRQHLEDFRVTEVPLYDPCGEGTHVYFRVVKAGIPTPAAVDRIARHMGVQPGQIGVAGLKDAKAVTSQMMSLEHADAARLAAYQDAQMRVTWTCRHTNKLRIGHLAGNSFAIRIRGVGADGLAGAQEILSVLLRRGVPNYFGPQRFGLREDTAALGEALVKDDPAEFVAVFLGRARQDDPPDCRAARDAFDAGYYVRALQCWPRHYACQRRALAAYKKKGKPGAAISAVDKRMKRLFISAFQSEIFNEVLAGRIQTIDRVVAGDLACKRDGGVVFSVVDVVAEQVRAEAFQISPTGPLVGYRSSLATDQPGVDERAVLDAHGVKQEDFRRPGLLKVKGSRRPLRARIEQAAIQPASDRHGEYLELTFTAPSGCYATSVLREIMKTDF